jgi:hypothetical protein
LLAHCPPHFVGVIRHPGKAELVVREECDLRFGLG